MFVIIGLKFLAIGFITITLAGASIGTGILFAGYSVAVSRNPEEAENLFNTALMAFALIETFVFMSFLVGAIIYFI